MPTTLADRPVCRQPACGAMLNTDPPLPEPAMRALLLLAALSLLGACASPLPAPDPQQAWIDFRTEPGELLMAEKLDGRRLDDGRYFQVSPGAHRLEASYRFEEYIGSMFA